MLLCTLSTSIVVTGCSSKNSKYEESVFTRPESKTIQESTKIPTKEIESVESTIETISKSTKDEQVLTYITNLSDSIDNGVEVITDKIKQGFITIIDFLFYDGEIADTTFRDLSNSTKEKVINITSNLIEKIDLKYPTFRLNLSEKYQNASTFIVEKKNILVDRVKESLGDEKVNQISEYYQDVKGDLSNLYEKGKEKVKNWYENFKDRHMEKST